MTASSRFRSHVKELAVVDHSYAGLKAQIRLLR